MPLEMPEHAQITIQKRQLPADFKMPQMEQAEKHFSLGYILSGDRQVITPFERYEAHAGDVTAMPPGIYHRTFSLSEKPYENYLIKVSREVEEGFCREVDREIWDWIFEQKRFSFDTQSRGKMEALLADMLELYNGGAPYAEAVLRGMFYRLLILIREKNTLHDRTPFQSELTPEIMDAMYFIEKNYAEDIKLADAAGSIGFSEGHFSRLFSASVGIPFSGYLINIRLRHAKELLFGTDLPVSEIALRTGFGSGDYLSACFRKYEGTSPTAFRKG
ncbi:MAG: AraC family transcriptional regulator [Lachnospiraceae bacterium]|nr:AraC family transcriptional regulator [Lachnospiraceae bacterium]